MISDEEYGSLLLRSLDDEPRTPSTVDVTRALAEGRRRRRNRKIRISCTGALAAVLALAGGAVVAAPAFQPTRPPPIAESTPAAPPSSASEPPSPTPSAAAPSSASALTGPPVAPPIACTVARMDVPGGRVKSIVTGGDPTGRYVTGRSYHDVPDGLQYRVWLWDNGVPNRVEMPGEDARLEDVNQFGVGVGFSYTSGGVTPYVYRDGAVTPLPGSGDGQALAVNARGTIVGWRGSEQRPVVWPSPTQAPASLPVPGGGEAYATDIGDDGTVVGQVGVRPYVWAPDGTGHYLDMPAGLGRLKAEFLQISGVWVIGRTVTSENPHREVGLRWNLRTGEAVQVRQFDGRPSRVNAQGWMTGFDTQGRAILVTSAGTLVMPDLSRHRAGGFTNMPDTLSDDGRSIAGQAYDPAIDDNLVVLWTCR